MFWDLSLKKYWRQFLLPNDQEYGLENVSRIDQELRYEDTNPIYIKQLERKIQLYLAKQIEEARRNHAEGRKHGHYMNWDRKLSAEIKEVLLTAFEQFKYTVKTPNFKCDFDDEHKNNTENAAKAKVQTAKNE